jgi:predicted molibdopterin-dependent oxidoreductase YjgC
MLGTMDPALKGQSVSIAIDGKSVVVAVGTSVAAAMWNHGARVSRTSVIGEPRSALCGMGICHECRATINGKHHERTCVIDCAAGMVIQTGEMP